MKLKLLYIPEEEREAGAALAALLRLFPGAKVRRDKSKDPKLAVYVTIDGAATLRYNKSKE